MAEVEFSDVAKVFPDGTRAVTDFTLQTQDGEFMVLVGPSGCGKTTALRMVAGLEDISEGQIKIGERVVNDVPSRDRDIAMVFQSYALYPHLSVYDNIAFSLRLRKAPKREINERVREAARVLDLEPLLDRKPRALSGGQRQRVAMGRAIVREPKAFLMDEPLSNLDAKLRVQMRAEISKLHLRLRTTFIYVTHDQTEAMTLGDRIAVLKAGDLMQCDSPHELFERPANMFVATFIGSPQMNLLRGDLDDAGGVQGKLFKGSLKTRNGEQPVVVGVRPEHVSLEKRAGFEFQSTVEVVEPVGAEAYVYLANEDGDFFVGRLPIERVPNVGDAITFYADADKVHLFDPRTEERI